jgi:hypothetical protein
MMKGEKMERELLGVRRYRAGYEIRTELFEEGFTMKMAYTTPEGHFIGDSKWAHRLIVQRGIKPEPRPGQCDLDGLPGVKGCCIGFCEREQKWYGWSHRAICGFGIGSKIESDDHLCSCSGWTEEYLQEHPEEDLSLPVGFVAQTIDDARRMAIAFADAVS